MSSNGSTTLQWRVRTHSPILLVDVFAPFIAFQLLTRFVHGMPVSVALAVASIFPLLSLVITFLRGRQLEAVAATDILAFAVAVAVAQLGGGARLAPLFITATFGVVLLVSLLLPTPAFYYYARQVHVAYDAGRRPAYDALLGYPTYRSGFRRMTLVWGLAAILEFLIQVGLYEALPAQAFSIPSTILKFGVIVLVMLWTILYAKRVSRDTGPTSSRAGSPAIDDPAVHEPIDET